VALTAVAQPHSYLLPPSTSVNDWDIAFLTHACISKLSITGTSPGKPNEDSDIAQVLAVSNDEAMAY